jgi:type I restriction enzyme S subunit
MKDGTFTAERLLALYDRVAEAEDAIPRLRRFVLDLAVRGKLVEQDPTDEPAAELLKRIAKEKAWLVKAGGFKKFEGILERDVTSFPFALPLNWQWTYLDDLAAIARGGSPRPIKSFLTDDPSGIPWIKIGDSTRGSIYIDETEERIIPEGVSRSRLVSRGDLLLSNSMSFGYPYITRIEGCIHDGWLVIRPPKHIEKLYLHKVFLSDFAKSIFAGFAAGAVVQNLNAEKVRLLPVPLPPLAEQQRIVAKVDELMALCERLQVARAGREAVRDRLTTATLGRLTAPETDAETFPSHAGFALQTIPTLTTRPDQIKTLRQTILNLAVRGKLVEQVPTEEPAAKLLKRIAEEKKNGKKPSPAKLPDHRGIDGIPIPHSWCWSTLGEVSLRLHYGFTASADPKLTEVRLLRITDIQDDRVDWSSVPGCMIDEKSLPSYVLSTGDLLIARTGGTIGKTFLVSDLPVQSVFASYLIRVQPARSLLDRYVKLFCGSEIYWSQLRDGSRGGGQPNVNGQTLGGLKIPLPPLAEQHRIVAKVDDLMALCDQLEASLITATTTRSRLLEALLHEALEHRAISASEPAE